MVSASHWEELPRHPATRGAFGEEPSCGGFCKASSGLVPATQPERVQVQPLRWHPLSDRSTPVTLFLLA